jgi:hypothetical protein
VRWLATSLLIVGVGLELAGLLILIRDISRGRRAMERFLHRTQIARPLGADSAVSFGFPTATVSGELTVQERLAALEHQVAALNRHLEETKQSLRAEWTDRISTVVATVAEGIRDQFEALAQLSLGDDPEKEQRWRRRGAWSLVLGLLAQTAANVLGLWAVR